MLGMSSTEPLNGQGASECGMVPRASMLLPIKGDREPTAPLAGKTVAVVHAAWHSCGSYQVNVSQLIAYKALGARVVSIALMDNIGPTAPQGDRWRDYLAASCDLPADRRFFTGAPFSRLYTSALLKDGWWPLIHGDQATWLIELAKRTPLPGGLESETIDLFHANHFFTLPFVEQMRAGRRIPIILESQDIQARQYVLRNRDGLFIPPYATYDDMLAIELEWMNLADLCIHLNRDEHLAFQRLLPHGRHALIYPAVSPAALGAGGRDIVIVASDNYANYLGLRWLFENVLPLAPGVTIDIFGTIVNGVKTRDKALFEAHRQCFKGRAADLGAVYANAACVLLPTLEGHGISIKAVEAFSSGAPLIATPLAFRGMDVDPRKLGNVVVAEDAESFAIALRDVAKRLDTIAFEMPRSTSDTRRFYDEVFSFDAYGRALAKFAVPMVCT